MALVGGGSAVSAAVWAMLGGCLQAMLSTHEGSGGGEVYLRRPRIHVEVSRDVRRLSDGI